MSLCLPKIQAMSRDRRNEIKDRFETFIENGHEEGQSSKSNGVSETKRSSGQLGQFEKLLDDLEALKLESREFKGHPNNVGHRVLNERCAVLLLQLDDYWRDTVQGGKDPSIKKGRLLQALKDVQEVQTVLDLIQM